MCYQSCEEPGDTGFPHCWMDGQCEWKSTLVRQSPLCLTLSIKKSLQHLPLQPSSLILKTCTGEPVPTKGLINVTVQVNGQTAVLPLYVVKEKYPSLLGRSWLEKLTLDWAEIHMRGSGDISLSVVLNKHAEVFKEGLGSMKNITVKLNIKPGSRPTFFRARPVPYAIKPKVEAELESLIKSGVLEPVSQSNWATPIVPVMK